VQALAGVGVQAVGVDDELVLGARPSSTMRESAKADGSIACR
jgi:hypothetical protein